MLKKIGDQFPELRAFAATMRVCAMRESIGTDR
jgi:hypothetical protein